MDKFLIRWKTVASYAAAWNARRFFYFTVASS